MVTVKLMKYNAPVEVDMTAAELRSIAEFLSEDKVQELFKDSWPMQEVAKQIIAQSKKVQDELYASYSL
jgi:hypothetical protein